MVIRFANVNGTGSASANDMFAKSVFRMGIPVSPKNIFPSNIQGLPTWYEVRVSEKGFLGRKEGIDILVGVNPQSMAKDIASLKPGGYFIYDSSRRLHDEYNREDIHFIGIPMMHLSSATWKNPRQQQLFKNIIYVGALSALIDLDIKTIKKVIKEQFAKKPKLVDANYKALDLGRKYAKKHFDCPLPVRLEKRNKVGDKILIDGNTALALGAIYGGATVAAWYPITPSTSVVKAFETQVKELRVDPETGKHNYAIIQAEDELAAIGMVLGANWNGARSFTATSGAGVSLMNEFIGLAYYAEIPSVLINVQRGGPSTGMPTRTQQGDLLSCAYASHGDTKHVLLFPSTPTECFEMMADAFDLADRLQTLIFVMSDLDLAMNNHMADPLDWDDKRKYDQGKVYTAEDLENISVFGRYLDVDGDALPYRTIPGTHPTRGSYFTRGSSHDEYARYTESEEVYVRMVDRISRKWETAKKYVPGPELYQRGNRHSIGMVFFGTSTYAALEAMVLFKKMGIKIDAMRVRALPFNDKVAAFMEKHDTIFVIEQNRDAQFRTLLMAELDCAPDKLVSVLNYDGFPITADTIVEQIEEALQVETAVATAL